MSDYYSTVFTETVSVTEWINVGIIGPSQELSAHDERCWVGWCLEMQDGKPSKVPYRLDGRKASPTNPDDWSTYAEVDAVRRQFSGIGIVLTGSILGIDMDHWIVDGNVPEQITTIIEAAKTYTEISPSGRGIHMYLKLTEPLPLISHKHLVDGYTGGAYEVYTTGRYFTYTAKPWKLSYPIRTVTSAEAFNILHLLGYPWKETPKPLLLSAGSEMDNKDLLQKMFSSKNGKKIEALYKGDTSAYGHDDSAADASLCSHLAFWTGGDASRVASLWLESPLGSRSKTQSRKDYQERTVNFAIKNCTATIGSSLHSVGIVKDHQTQDPQVSPSPFTVISGPELLAMDIPPVEWQIESLFAKGTLNMISAPPNQFKSFVALRMALSVANGLPLFNEFETAQCNVLYVNEEDNHAENKRRYEMLLQDGEQDDGVFFVIESGRKIDAKWAKEIAQITEDRNIGFVILDSLRALHLENENESHLIQPIMDDLRILTRRGLTVLFTHHHRKGKLDDQSENGTDMARGSTAITAAIHGHLTCQEKKTGGQPYLVISQPKLKAAKKLDPFIVTMGEQLEPRHMSFYYTGPYDTDMTASNAMEAKLVIHFREHTNEYFTRKHLAELHFATSADDKTLRSALSSLVEKKQLEQKKYSELSDADKKLVPGKNPKNTVLYKFVADKPDKINSEAL
jgi:hypothetical protein